MKSVSGSLKLELATFEELSSFAQFSSDIDPETQKVIDHGNRLVELLKQPAYQIINHELIILSMYLSEYGWLDKLKLKKYVHLNVTCKKLSKTIIQICWMN